MRIRAGSRFFCGVLVTALLAGHAVAGWAADKKEWMTYPKCRYLASPGNDGDSFLVDCGSDEFFVRLYFVDAPEKDQRFPERTRLQAVHFCVSTDATLRAGARADAFVARTLSETTFAVQTRKALAMGSTKLPRYYSVVSVKDRYLHEALLLEGLAQNKGKSITLPGGKKAGDYRRDLQALEDRAKRERKGVWETTKANRKDCDIPRPKDL